VLAAVALSLALMALLAASAGARTVGDVQVLALIPTPGYPALPHVVGNKIFEGTYDDPEGSALPSRVLKYTAGGELLNSWTIDGQDVSQPHGVQVAANEANGDLLLLDKTSGRIILFDPKTNAQTLYSTVPHIPPCSSAPAGTECKDSTQDLAPMPDYAAWGPDGSLYVTDYQQAAIWRIPPGGGTAQLWLTSPLLDGGMFGTACMVLMPNHSTLLFDQASNGGLGAVSPTVGWLGGINLSSPTLPPVVDPATGKLYEVSIESGDRPGPLQQIWESGPADAPDGCALSTSGDIYVALSGASNQIVELSPSGQQLNRFGQQFTGDNDSSIPFDTPSGLGCLGTDLIVANQAYLDGNTANMALLNVETGQQCAPVFVPAKAASKPAAHKKKKKKKKRKHRVSPVFTG
jgi:hypothetical protein